MKAHYLREYAMKNNFMPELFRLISNGESDDNYDIFEQFTVYIESIIPSMKGLLIKRMKAGNKLDGIITTARELVTGEETDDSSSSESDDSGSDDSGGGDDDMMGDFGMDDDMGDGESEDGDTDESGTDDNNDTNDTNTGDDEEPADDDV